MILDPQDRILDLNPAAQKLVPLPYPRQLGVPISYILPELAGLLEDGRLHQERHAELALDRGPLQDCYEVAVIPLSGPSDATLGRLLVFHNITQLKQEQAEVMKAYAKLEDRVSERTRELRDANRQLEAELEQRRLAERRFEDIVNNAPDAILLIDPDGKIIQANDQAEFMFGWPVAELGRMLLIDLLPEDQRAGYPAWLREFFARPSRHQLDPQLNLRGLRRDRSQFPVEVHLSPLKTSQGLLAACIVRDITLRKQAEQEQAALLQEISASHEQLRQLTATLAEAEEIERRKIAVELHDRVGQNLTALNLNLTSIGNKLPPGLKTSIQSRLLDSLGLVEETTRQVRDVMADLNPPMIDEYGLLPALRWYGERFTARTGVRVSVAGEECSPRPPHRVEMTLFRIVQEALNNVARHASAAQVSLSCVSSGQGYRLCMEDDGVGFDPAGIDFAGEQPHWGLLTMKERAASIGGSLEIQSAPGQGTRVVVEIRRGSDGD